MPLHQPRIWRLVSLTRACSLRIFSAPSVGRMPEWLKGADCKSAGLRLRWFESSSYHHSDFSDSGYHAGAWCNGPRPPLALILHQVYTAIFVDDKRGKLRTNSTA